MRGLLGRLDALDVGGEVAVAAEVGVAREARRVPGAPGYEVLVEALQDLHRLLGQDLGLLLVLLVGHRGIREEISYSLDGLHQIAKLLVVLLWPCQLGCRRRRCARGHASCCSSG